MARPNKLSPEQFQQAATRFAKGEAMRDIAKDFHVTPNTLRNMGVIEESEIIKSAAKQVVKANAAIDCLPVIEQEGVLTLAQMLMDVSTHLGSAARFSSMSANTFARMANAEIIKIDSTIPLADQREVMGTISDLQGMATHAASIPLNLLRANKDFVDEQNRKPAAGQREKLVSIDPVEASREYQRIMAG
jgi:hypothetical protein